MKNNSKRIFALLLAIVMCVSCVVPVFAEVNVHDHAEETPAAKCPGVGEEHTFANCDSTFVETVDPQCGKFGYDLYECNTCKAPVVTNWTNPNNEDHKYGEPVVVKAPTCYEVGKQVATCANCGHEKETELPKIAHTITNNKVVGALCKDGIPAWTEWCTAEGCDYKVEHEAEAGHDCDSRYVAEIVKQPTCYENGLAIVKCRDCSYESTEVVVNATNGGLGHKWIQDGKFTIDPTCGTAGSGNAKCSVCGATAEVVNGVVTVTLAGVDEPIEIEVEDFKATGIHDFSVEVEAKESTCDEAGWQAHKKCANCDATSLDGETEADVTLPMKGHAWVDVPEKAATCTKDGNVAHFECSACGALTKNGTDIVTKADVVAPAGHSYDLDGEPTAESAPTCTKFGFKYYGCVICGMPASSTGDENIELPADEAGFVAPGVYRLPMLAHDTELVSVEVEGDCVTDRVEIYACACGYTVKKVTPAPDHTLKTEVVDPTCSEEGYSIDICDVCGELLQDKYDVVEKNPDNHTIGEIYDSTPANCTQEGQTIGWCEDCGKLTTEIVPALGHDYDYENPIEVDETNKEATCEKDGVIVYTYKCKNCDATQKGTDTVAEATGHNYVTVTNPATCTAKGYDTHTCACGDTYEDNYVDVLPHELSVDPSLTVLPECILGAPTLNGGKPGYEVKKCANCDYTEVGDAIEFDWNNPAHHPGSKATDEYKPGNCTEPAYLYYECPHCERTFYAIDDSMLGKHEIDTTNTELYGAYVAPTCTTAGEYEHGACAKCENAVYVNNKGEFVIYDDEADYVIEALGHAWVDAEGKDATCTATGVKAYSYCARLACMLHTLDRDVEEIVPFDAADLKNVILIPAKGHNFDTELVAEVPATCTEDGVKAHYECADCDAVSLDGEDACDASELVINAINHKDGWINGESETANCLEAGYDYKYCKFCGIEEVYNYVYPLGHKFVDVAEDSATCIATGVAAHKYCTECKKDFAADETDIFSTNYKTESDLELPMLPHVNANGDVITAACDSNITDRKCAACGQTIEAIHNKVYNNIDATCQEYGYTAWYCTICKANHVEQNDEFAPTNPGHEDEDLLVWKTLAEADLYNDGAKQLYCPSCKTFIGDPVVIPAKGGVKFTYKIENAIVPGAEYVNGGRIKLTIEYEAVNTSLSSIALALEYNSKIFAFDIAGPICAAKDANGNNIFNADAWNIVGNNKEGYVVVLADTFAPMSEPADKVLNGKGVFAELYFNINQDYVAIAEQLAAGKLANFTLVADDSMILTSKEDNLVNKEFTAATEALEIAKLGDLNGDGKYDNADKLEFLNIAYDDPALENKSEENPTGEVVYLAIADVNQDGFIGLDDYNALLKRVSHGGDDTEFWGNAQN